MKWTGIIFSTFQGELRVETQQVVVRPDSTGSEKPQFDIDRGGIDFDGHLDPYS
jgi:U4/U6.U5 tri-snRNP-associated protein 2